MGLPLTVNPLAHFLRDGTPAPLLSKYHYMYADRFRRECALGAEHHYHKVAPQPSRPST
jgi:hypothetical protein